MEVLQQQLVVPRENSKYQSALTEGPQLEKLSFSFSESLHLYYHQKSQVLVTHMVFIRS